MQQSHVFEYAVIRVMPQVEREEFINVGVIMYCARQKFLQCRLLVDEQRLIHFAPQLDVAEVKQHLHSFSQICCGAKEGGPIARLDIASRFRWLTAIRSTVVQASRVHPGLCDEPEETIEKLFRQLVG